MRAWMEANLIYDETFGDHYRYRRMMEFMR